MSDHLSSFAKVACISVMDCGISAGFKQQYIVIYSYHQHIGDYKTINRMIKQVQPKPRRCNDRVGVNLLILFFMWFFNQRSTQKYTVGGALLYFLLCFVMSRQCFVTHVTLLLSFNNKKMPLEGT